MSTVFLTSNLEPVFTAWLAWGITWALLVTWRLSVVFSWSQRALCAGAHPAVPVLVPGRSWCWAGAAAGADPARADPAGLILWGWSYGANPAGADPASDCPAELILPGLILRAWSCPSPGCSSRAALLPTDWEELIEVEVAAADS